MSARALDRRRFLSTLGASAVALPSLAQAAPTLAGETSQQANGLIRLDKNENPAGPFASARRAITAALDEAGRYPGAAIARLTEAIARANGVGADRVVVGCGSSEILRWCTEQFTSPTAGLVAAHPTFEDPAAIASRLRRPVRSVPVKGDLGLDLDAMATAARGAGLVFLCNPNNPTSTVHGAAAVRGFIARVRRESPDTIILVDEAYHEYVDDPSYATMVPETGDPHVVVSRTFSKVYGMAGLRVGYAIAAPATASRIASQIVESGVSQTGVAAALASLNDAAAVRAERERNAAVRASVTKWFSDRGFTGPRSHTNFVLMNIRRDVRPVIAACLERGVAVGRPFPPLDTHLRLSMGTASETERALQVLGRVLASG